MDQDDSRATPAAHDPYAALRVADYRRFLLAGILTSAGIEMQVAAVGWEIFKRTESAASLGYVRLAMVIPVLILALPAGHAADKYSRKGLLMGSQALMGLASMFLAILSFLDGPVAWIYVALTMAGIGHAVSRPSRWAILRQIVSKDLVRGAITWNSSGLQVASVFGPALAGVLIARFGGAAWVYTFDAVLAVVVLWLQGGMRPAKSERLVDPASLDSLLAGLKFVGRTRMILASITLDLFAVLLGGAVALLPMFASEILKVGPVGYGWLQAAPAIGAGVMALVLAHRPPLRNAGPAMFWAVAGFGVATIVFGFSRNFYLSMTMLMLTGALDNISVVVRSTLVQILTPESMRGRVAAVNSLFIGSSNELGGFESGITAQWFGPVASVVGGGVGTLAVVVLVRLIWPDLAKLGSLHDLEPAPVLVSDAGTVGPRPVAVKDSAGAGVG